MLKNKQIQPEEHGTLHSRQELKKELWLGGNPTTGVPERYKRAIIWHRPLDCISISYGPLNAQPMEMLQQVLAINRFEIADVR